MAGLCLDARMIRSSGIGTYTRGLLEGLGRKKDFGVSLSLLGDPDAMPRGPWTVQELSAPIYSISEQWRVPWAVRRLGATLLHAPHYNMPMAMPSRTIVTVHDVIHLKFPHYWPSPLHRAYANFFFYHVVPKARAVITVSQNTKRDLIEILGLPESRITVTYLGVSHDRCREPDPSLSTEFEKFDLPNPYLLYVGNLKEFKNVERLVEAYHRLKNRDKNAPALVLVGRNFIKGFDARIKNTPGIRWLGEVDAGLLPWLYKHALALLFPSLYEGFGLPPLEAMACGTPVLCSNRASLPEVAGDAAFFVDPEDTESMTAGIKRLVEDSALRQDLAAKGLRQAARFSWDAMAEQTLRVYHQCLS